MASALQRLVREGARTSEERLRHLESHWVEVEPTAAVRRQAERFLRMHPLRAADALQLAAALVACPHEPVTLAFQTADERLAAAARREGLAVPE